MKSVYYQEILRAFFDIKNIRRKKRKAIINEVHTCSIIFVLSVFQEKRRRFPSMENSSLRMHYGRHRGEEGGRNNNNNNNNNNKELEWAMLVSFSPAPVLSPTVSVGGEQSVCSACDRL